MTFKIESKMLLKIKLEWEPDLGRKLSQAENQKPSNAGFAQLSCSPVIYPLEPCPVLSHGANSTVALQ